MSLNPHYLNAWECDGSRTVLLYAKRRTSESLAGFFTAERTAEFYRDVEYAKDVKNNDAIVVVLRQGIDIPNTFPSLGLSQYPPYSSPSAFEITFKTVLSPYISPRTLLHTQPIQLEGLN
ncbi:hypothetical protein SERLA73DRAFT_69148 [Serpula lacrymans var. lacrymans S7.3]|uniref:Uncharacterized protein n=1 Tax=Serpula lacrymans var. lacrymans (strain S7.3) TaxID=936435 RepID=F8PJP4_SERL3|nr:hypothetical protein SERLA73DRAFT_69148 [Serpula lacrymans var. lacrymans S7.3]